METAGPGHQLQCVEMVSVVVLGSHGHDGADSAEAAGCRHRLRGEETESVVLENHGTETAGLGYHRLQCAETQMEPESVALGNHGRDGAETAGPRRQLQGQCHGGVEMPVESIVLGNFGCDGDFAETAGHHRMETRMESVVLGPYGCDHDVENFAIPLHINHPTLPKITFH